MSFAGRGRRSTSGAGGAGSVVDSHASEQFGVTVEELRQLMEYRGQEARELLDKDYGGVRGLCDRLHTDPANGIPKSESGLQRRKQVC